MIQNRIRKGWTDATLMNKNSACRNLVHHKQCNILDPNSVEVYIEATFYFIYMFYLIL